MTPRHPETISQVTLDGRTLGRAEIVAVARHRARVQLAAEARDRIARSRAVVERLVAERAKVYGLTTGFGSKRDVVIEPKEVGQLQVNLIRSHAAGVGTALPEDETRAVMLLRANTLARGNSGVRVQVVEALLAFLNHDVYPWLPSRGSLGASGDLAPLSHLALALCGDPDARFYRRGPEEAELACITEPVRVRFEHASDRVFSETGIEPLTLQAKEGLALNNGTQVTTAIGMLALHDGMMLLESAELVCALSLEANKAIRDAFDPRLHGARPVPGQCETAANLLAFTDGSQILKLPLNNARLHRARWALAAACDRLAMDPAAAALLARARSAADALEVFENEITATPEEAYSEAERAALPDRVIAHRVYAGRLTPLRAEVTALYAEVLKSALTGEAAKAQDVLADALLQLQLALPETPSVQDDYSFRCTPQVLGAVRKAVADAERTLAVEANSATDNPLIFPPRADDTSGDAADYAASLSVKECMEAVVSGGNFHGEPLAMALDSLGIAFAELGNISERRTAHLVDGNLSNGLPSLLVEKSGLNSGFMIPQYVAAALVSENKILSHPASVDSIPSCENTEDHVSMSPIAALKCRQILGNVQSVVAIELITAWQGVYFRRPLACGAATERLWSLMEAEGMTPVRNDRVLYKDIEWARELLASGRVWKVAREFAPSMLD